MKSFHRLLLLGFGVAQIKSFHCRVAGKRSSALQQSVQSAVFWEAVLAWQRDFSSLTRCLQYHGRAGSNLKVSSRSVSQTTIASYPLLYGFSHCAEQSCFGHCFLDILYILCTVNHSTQMGNIYPGQLRPPVSMWPVSRPLKKLMSSNSICQQDRDLSLQVRLACGSCKQIHNLAMQMYVIKE